MWLKSTGTEGMFDFTRSMNRSMESALTPAPLCLLAWVMVSQMLPGSAYCCVGGGGGGLFLVGTGVV